LPGVGERCTPRATWSCIDEPLKLAGRSRSASLPTPGKGRAGRHRLLREAFMSHLAAPRPSLKLPGMLDEPDGSLPLSPEQRRQPVVPSLGGKQQPPLCVAQGQDERARPRPVPFLRGTDSAWAAGSLSHRESGTRWRAAADGGATGTSAGTVWATPLAHRLPALARALAALRGAPRARRSGVGGSTQAACGRGACASRAASKVAV
jgi:hypothetical protein